MSYKQTLSNTSPKKGFSLGLQPAPAWAAIITLVIFVSFCTLIRAGSLLRLFFPAGTFAVAVLLYRRYPLLYVGFTWWIWFLAPLISRLVEFQSGANPQARQMIIVAPYLMTSLTLTTFLPDLPKMHRQGGLPFVLAFCSVMYSFLIAVVRLVCIDKELYVGVDPAALPYTPMKIAVGLLSWVPQIAFGYYLFKNWRNYPSFSQNIQRTFCWGVLVTGIYGVVQYVVAPPWDVYWWNNSPEMQLSSGWPEPFMLRVWSTSNTVWTFASLMMAGLLLLFSNRRPTTQVPSAIAGFLSFLLSQVRSAWVAWVVGVLAFMVSLKPQLQIRFLVTILVIGLCVVPLTTIEPFSEVISSRVESLSNLQQDQSLSERSEIYATSVKEAVSEVLGKGLGGSKIVDAGILDVLNTFGWFGIIPYMGGIILLLFTLFQYSEVRFDSFMNSARAISISVFTLLPWTNTLLLIHGMLFWAFAGITMAAHTYHQHQRKRAVVTDNG